MLEEKVTGEWIMWVRLGSEPCDLSASLLCKVLSNSPLIFSQPWCCAGDAVPIASVVTNTLINAIHRRNDLPVASGSRGRIAHPSRKVCGEEQKAG